VYEKPEQGATCSARKSEATPVASEPPPAEAPPGPSRRSLRGLDWFVFCVADVQTGFGPFVAVYLTTQKWTQVDIGLVLSVAGLVALFGQVPGGAIVDAARSERRVAGLGVAGIAVAALIYAAWPVFPAVLTAAVLHAGASTVLGPAIAAISLGLVGHAAIGERLGRNSRFASLGTGLAAAAMGACGYFFSARAVFIVTALLLLPTLFALRQISEREVNPERAHGGAPQPNTRAMPYRMLLRQRMLLILGGCVALFHLANAAMLPLMGTVLTARSPQTATALIAACIVVPQCVVATIAPWVGRQSQVWGRRPLLLLGFAVLPIRGLLFATVTDPYALVAVQVLDGIAGACFGVMVPLIIADLTRGTGRFNSAQGLVGMMTGVGAATSQTLAGYLATHFGSEFAFLTLSLLAVVALIAVACLVRETRPREE
jgi:MFS family permease